MSKPKLKMVEIYSEKDEQWKGWHNLILDVDGNAGNNKAIQGPIDPETSKQILKAIRALCKKSTSSNYKCKECNDTGLMHSDKTSCVHCDQG